MKTHMFEKICSASFLHARSIRMALLGALAAFAPATALAVDTANPDWPCVQAKVEKLTSAQIWDGPSVDEIDKWWEDEEVAKLARYIVSRRVEMEEAETAIREFAETMPEGKERDDRLTLLFAGVLDETNKSRSQVVRGIERFQQRQVARSKRLQEQSSELAELHNTLGKESRSDEKVMALQEKYDWNARVFKERQDSIPVACEIPVDIEQRAFALGRVIRFHMS